MIPTQSVVILKVFFETLKNRMHPWTNLPDWSNVKIRLLILLLFFFFFHGKLVDYATNEVARFENMATLHPFKLNAMYVYWNPVLGCWQFSAIYIFDWTKSLLREYVNKRNEEIRCFSPYLNLFTLFVPRNYNFGFSVLFC